MVVVVSNGWLEHVEDVQNFLTSNGLIEMSTQSITPSMNVTAAATLRSTDWSAQQPTTIATTTPVTPATPLQAATNNQPPQQQQANNVATNQSQTSSSQSSQLPQQQQQQQAQQPQQSQPCVTQNGGQPNAKGASTVATGPQRPKAILICQPNSHPFQNRKIFLDGSPDVKVGRAVAKNRVTESNAIFDCKVLSRNHAVIWYAGGKFFIKDTGSSNGTFINSQRLSQTCVQSDPFEVCSGDVVQFGVDVTENSRKETHGCIVALLKLYLPDGRETKGRHMGISNAKIPHEYLHRLNQFIQEAVQREQILESKLANLHKIIEVTRKNSGENWQAMIDEDRLLSRIDILENKLQYFQKNCAEDKLREDVLKLHDDKSVYQNSAKEALRKVYQERMDALTKLSAIERALCSSEDECSLLRNQIMKTQQNLQEVTSRLFAMEAKCDELSEKCTHSESRSREHESEIQSLYAHIKLQTIGCEDIKNQLDATEKEKQQLVAELMIYEGQSKHSSDEETERKQTIIDWLKNSDLKGTEGSEDIIRAICNDSDTNDSEINNIKLSYTDIHAKLLNIEKQFQKIEQLNNSSSSSSSDSSVTHLDNSIDSSSTTSTMTNDETTIGSDPVITDSAALDGDGNNDGNQNVSKPHMNEKDAEMIREIIQKLKCVYNELLKALVPITSIQHQQQQQRIKRADDDENFKQKYDALEAKYSAVQSEVQTLQLELETRPTYNQYQEKVKVNEDLLKDVDASKETADALKLELAQLQQSRQHLVDKMSSTIMQPSADVTVQTDVNVIDDVSSSSLSSSPNVVANHKSITEEVVPQLSAANDSNVDVATANHKASCAEQIVEPDEQMDTELAITNSKQVQCEEELIMFKENCEHLTNENNQLKKEMVQLKESLQHTQNRFLMQIMLWLAPMVALLYYFVAPYF